MTAMAQYQAWMRGHVDRIGLNALARAMGVNPSTILAYEVARAIPERFREPVLAVAMGEPLRRVRDILRAAREERMLLRAQKLGYDPVEAMRRLTELPRKRPRQGPRPTRGASAAALPRPVDEARAVATPKPRPVGALRLRRPSYRTWRRSDTLAA